MITFKACVLCGKPGVFRLGVACKPLGRALYRNLLSHHRQAVSGVWSPDCLCCQRRPRGLAQAQASSRLPRFYCETTLPDVVGSSLQLSATESKHATRVLRLTDNTLVEVCDGQGQIVIGRLVTTAKAAAHIVTTTPSQQVLILLLLPIHPSLHSCAANFVSYQVPWEGCKWELAVACGSLQSSRADWLVEKCTELGAWSFRPILTDRSPGIGISAIACIRPSTPDALQDTTLGQLARLGLCAC